MTGRLAAILLPVLVGATFASAAWAKGPTEVTLVGPGLDAPIVFGGMTTPGVAANPDRPRIDDLPTAAGLYRAAWGTPLPMTRPDGDLGPRYTLTYRLPGPAENVGRIVQHVYPYAEPHGVTYTEPGQSIWPLLHGGAPKTKGGWFVGPAAYARPLRTILVEAGLPPDEPTDKGSAGVPRPAIEWLVLTGAVLVGATVVLLTRGYRKRGGQALA